MSRFSLSASWRFSSSSTSKMEILAFMIEVYCKNTSNRGIIGYFKRCFMILCNFETQIEPETGPFRLAGGFFTGAIEFVEDAFFFFRCYSRAFVLHRKTDMPAFILKPDGNGFFAGRIFQCIF